MAYRDALTGLYNRRYANERLPAVLDEAAAHGLPVSIAILDLDHFKRINDTLSHSVGDTVLQHVASLLLEETSGSMIAARIGGEEFLLIMPGIGAAEATRRCEQLRLKIRAHRWSPITGALAVTTSIGVTTDPQARDTPSELLAAADSNLYRAKHDGRDRVAGPTP
jgi:diguanylate cyclase (GGDEF)-like protein